MNMEVESKDHVIRNQPILFSREHDILLRDYEDEDKSFFFSTDHVEGHKPDPPPKDFKSGSEHNILSHCGKEHDNSSTDYLQGGSKSDVLLSIDLVDKEKSNGLSKDGECRENNVVLEDHKGVDELQNVNVKKNPGIQLKGADGRDEHKAFTPSKSQKVSKNKRKRNGPMESAFLYQAYLDMISSVHKKMKADPITEKKVQPPNSEKSITLSELGETSMINASTSQSLKSQKKNYDGNQFFKEFSRKQFRQKKAALRRDLLADSSEAFLSFLDSAGGSEEFQECNDGPGILDRIGSSSSNEISEFNYLTSGSNDSSDAGLKRCAEHMLPCDNILIQKRSTMYPHLLTKIQCKLGFQVVIMKDSHGSPLRNVDLDEVQHLLDAEVIRFTLQNEKSHFIPQFFGLRVDQNYNWLILNCKDRDTVNWVLNWNPLHANRTFTIVEYEKAPWRSIMICFTIRKDNLDEEEVVRMLANQNRTLDVADWRNFRVTGHQGEWTLYFLLTADESKQLDEVGWVICFEHGTLQVLKL